MVKNLTTLAIICCLFGLTGCGGSSDSGSSVEESGSLAGTWTASVNAVTHTITIVGFGNTYDIAWDTSDYCFISDSGTTIHIDQYVEILCSGYYDNEQSYLFLSIYGEYNGENTVAGNMYAEECGADNQLVDLTRQLLAKHLYG